MRFDKLNLLEFGIIGGIIGGLIAIVGFLILSPSTDSVILFVMLRVIVGSIAAVIIGFILTKNRSKPNKF